MSLYFPSRFLKKLDIYQQIRNGEGISKYKRLWKYEASFLQYSYLEGHQHLSDFVSRSNFKKWITSITEFDPKNDEAELSHIIANLFWRGYIDIVDRVNSRKLEKQPKGLELFNRNQFAFKSNEFGDESNFDYRVTIEGLLIGEVLSEINNENIFLRYWNRYRYNLVLDTTWLLVIWAILTLFTPEVLQYFNHLSVNICSFQIVYPWTTLIFIFIIWPFIGSIYRLIYNFLEKR